ncbi:hypothetical protein GCM10023314_23780 [Algibacter agarivorans]|uniref:Uncharacterized protein n=2 Tax=Algibacter agarivorans TaxID=1109741 RepID=A0ABP9GXS8_9FLAO
MRFLMILIFLGFSYTINAQEVNFNGVTYKIEKERIFKDNIDVTETLTLEKKQQIRTAFDKKLLQIEESEQITKRLKKVEKDKKSAIKKQKKAEKSLKQKKKTQSNFDKSGKKHQGAIKKYDKLKKKGKLSPEDESKWLKKIEKLKVNHQKAKKKLKRT